MEMQIKYFTLAEAKKTLPLVRQIVKDILKTAQEIWLITENPGNDSENNPVIIKLTDQINGYIKEIEDLGCYYKDWNFSIGLVDFPSVIQGREVLFCWRSDEEEIIYYHDLEAGYLGRKLIPDEYL